VQSGLKPDAASEQPVERTLLFASAGLFGSAGRHGPAKTAASAEIALDPANPLPKIIETGFSI
jgi:hypothetical protein